MRPPSWNGPLDVIHYTVGSHRAVGFADHRLCRIVASFEYSVITMVNDVKLTVTIWRTVNSFVVNSKNS